MEIRSVTRRRGGAGGQASNAFYHGGEFESFLHPRRPAIVAFSPRASLIGADTGNGGAAHYLSETSLPATRPICSMEVL